MINAGTIMAYLDLDTSQFSNAMQLASTQMDDMQGSGSGLSNTLDAIGAGMTTVGRALTLGVTTPLLGVGVAIAKAAIDWESAFADVRKTVNITSGDVEAGFQRIADGLIAMSEQIPVSKEGLAGIAAAAGQLGVAEADILGFTQVMADLNVATNLSGEEAATMFAQYANIMGWKDFSNIERLGSTIVELGNNTATTEKDIAEMMHRLAGAGAIIGLSDAQTAGLSATLTSLGINAEAGGSAMSRVLSDMQSAVIGGGKDLKAFAKIAGVSGKEFSAAWQADPLEALQLFTTGLNAISLAGGDVNAALDAVGLSDVRITDMLKRLMGSGDLLTETVGMANKAWVLNTALSEEAAQRYATVESKIQMLKNAVGNVATQFGDVLMPVISTAVDWLMKGVQWIGSLDDGIKKAIVTAGGIAAALGPALLVGGKLVSAFSGVLPLFTLVGGSLALVYKHSERLQGVVAGLGSAFGKIKTGFNEYNAALKSGAAFSAAMERGVSAAFGADVAAQIAGVAGAIATGFNTARKAISGAAEGIGTFVGSLIDGRGVAASFEKALQAAFGGNIPQSVRGLQADISGLFTQIREDFAEGGILQVLQGLGSLIADGLRSGIDAAKAKLSDIGAELMGGITNIKAWIVPKAQAMMADLGTALQNAKGYVIAKLPVVRNAIVSGLGLAKIGITNAARDAMRWMGEAYRSSTVQNALGNITSAGEYIMSQLAAGKDYLFDKAGEILGNLGEAMGSSAVLDKIGDLSGIVAGIAGKIASNAGAWKATAARLIGDLVTQLTDSGFLQAAITGLGTIAESIISGIATAAVNWAGAAMGLLGQLVESLTKPGLISGLFASAAGIVGDIASVIVSAAGSIIPAAVSLATTLIEELVSQDWATIFTTGATVVKSIGDIIIGAASSIVPVAKSLASALVTGIDELPWETIFTTASDVVKSIAGLISTAAPSIVSAASDIVTSLTNKLTESGFISGLFTNAADVVVSIADTIAANAGSIGLCATDLAKTLLNGLAAVDWATVSTSLAKACNNLTKALIDFLTEPETLDKFTSVGVSIAGAFAKTIAEEAKSPTLLNPIAWNIDMKPVLNAASPNYFGAAWASDYFAGLTQGAKDGSLSAAEEMALAVALIGEKYRDRLTEISPELAESAFQLFQDIYSSTTINDIKSNFAQIGFDITDSLALAIGNGSVTISDALRALGIGMNEEMILSMSQLELQEYLNNYIISTSSTVSTLLEGEASNWGRIFGQAIPEGATAGLEDGMAVLRDKTGEIIAMVSAVDAEASVAAGNKATAEAGMDAMKSGITGKQGEVSTAATTAADALETPFAGLPEETKAHAEAMLAGIKLAIEAGTPAATEATTAAAQAVVNEAATIMSEGAGKTIGITFATALGTGVSSKRVELQYGVKSVAEVAVSTAAGIMTAIAGSGIGSGMIQGVINGINYKASALYTAMRYVALSAVSAFRSALDMHSPSRILLADGAMMTESIGLGVTGNARAAIDSMAHLANDMAAAWPGVDVEPIVLPDVDFPDWPDWPGNPPPWPTPPPGGAAAGDGGVHLHFDRDVIVREDKDITRIAEELYEMMKDDLRGGGG